MSMKKADDLLWFKQVMEEMLPEGLSITYQGEFHLWPAKFRPHGETFADTMRYTMKAIMDGNGTESKELLIKLEESSNTDGV